MRTALERFAAAAQQKFSSHVSGEPEDQLRARFGHLLAEAGGAIGLDLLAIGEILLANRGGKPDFGVSSSRLLCGHIELKAPGKGADTSAFAGQVAQSRFGYRMKNRKGKKSSPLDDIAPKEWSSETISEFLRLLNLLTRTLALHPQQSQLLDDILAGPLIGASSLGSVPMQWRAAPKVNDQQHGLELQHQ